MSFRLNLFVLISLFLCLLITGVIDGCILVAYLMLVYCYVTCAACPHLTVRDAHGYPDNLLFG